MSNPDSTKKHAPRDLVDKKNKNIKWWRGIGFFIIFLSWLITHKISAGWEEERQLLNIYLFDVAHCRTIVEIDRRSLEEKIYFKETQPSKNASFLVQQRFCESYCQDLRLYEFAQLDQLINVEKTKYASSDSLQRTPTKKRKSLYNDTLDAARSYIQFFSESTDSLERIKMFLEDEVERHSADLGEALRNRNNDSLYIELTTTCALFVYLLGMCCLVVGWLLENTRIPARLRAPIKLTTSGRGKLTTYFAGEDLYVQVCQWLKKSMSVFIVL